MASIHVCLLFLKLKIKDLRCYLQKQLEIWILFEICTKVHKPPNLISTTILQNLDPRASIPAPFRFTIIKG